MASVIQNKAIVRDAPGCTGHIEVVEELGKVDSREAVRSLARARKDRPDVYLISYSK